MKDNLENNEDQLAQKQELLKNEIVSKNYDPNKFLQFCLYQKENGDDMNNWTFDELKKCVEKFIETQKLETEKNIENTKNKESKDISKNKNQKNNEDINKDEIKEYKEKEDDIIKKENDDKKSENEEYFFENKMHELPCKILEKSILNNKDIKVTLKNPKTNEKSLLAGSYVTYEVFTEPICWLVKRRFSDFFLLRQILCKYYPRMFIPPLPEKKIGNKRFEQDFIERRMKFLQIFINNIIKNEELKANEAVLIFLNFNDHSQFERKMKELNNYTYSSNFKDIKTLSGKLKILDNENVCDKYISSIGNFCKSQKQIFNRLNSSLKSYYRNISSACQNLEEISKCFEELHTSNIEVETKEEITKTYNILSYFFKEMEQMMNKENEIIHSKIKRFFKLQKLINSSYLEIVERREKIKHKYIEENSKLFSKKQKLYSIKDINKWEIINFEKIDKPRLLRDKNYAFEHMCEKDSLYVNNLYNNLAYSNYMNFEEYQKIIDENIKSYTDNTKEFTKLIYPIFNNRISILERLNSYI